MDGNTGSTQLSSIAAGTVFYNLADERTFPEIKEEQQDATTNDSPVQQTSAGAHSNQIDMNNCSHEEHGALQFSGDGKEASCETCRKACPNCHVKKKCDVCGGVFVGQANFAIHRRIHTGERPYKCTICSACFRQSGHLSRHIIIHTGEKPYECQACGARFRQQNHLKQHHASVHSDEHPFKCARCLAGFSQRRILSEHLLIHTGEKRYQCKVCGNRFRHHSNLKRHQASVHSDERPFKCARCLAGFSQRRSLSKHLLIHTGEKRFQCEKCGQKFSQKVGLISHHASIHSSDRKLKQRKRIVHELRRSIPQVQGIHATSH